MLGEAELGQAEVVRGRYVEGHFRDVRGSFPVTGTVVAPCENDLFGPLESGMNGRVVVGADRVFGIQQSLGIRGHKGEQVDDLEESKAPVAGESDAPADCGVVANFVRRRRVEHDEQDAAL